MLKVKLGIKDITGKRYGYLTAIEPTEKRRGSNVIWLFHCDCGNYVEKETKHLSDLSNCGCIGNEALRRKNLIPGVNDLVTLRPDLAEEWDYEKNGLKRPENRTLQSSDKVYWLCKKGHPSYMQVIANRTLQNQGCPYCSHNRVAPGETDLATLRPDLLNEWDNEKNLISPCDVTPHSTVEVYWKCPDGHEYRKSVRDRVAQVYGCPWCSNKRRILANRNDLKSQYPDVVREEWDFSKNIKGPSEVTAWSREKVWWLCPLGHSYQQQIDNHIKVGQGCPYCTNKKVWKGFNDVPTTHPELICEWHEDNKKRPEECIAGSHILIKWRCKDCGHVWTSSLKSRAYAKQGCPRCAFAYKSSELEQVLFYYLRKVFPQADNSYRPEWLGRMEIDIFIPEINAGVEYDGGKWHKNIDKDTRKTRKLMEHGITLFRLRDERNPRLDDGSIVIPVSREVDKSLVQMEPYVKKLLETINLHYGLTTIPDINIKRDLPEIQSLFNTKKKGKSVASDPQKLLEWDDEANRIRPERISIRSHRSVTWKCSLCDKRWEMPPHRKKGLGCPDCKRKAARIETNKKRLQDGVTKSLLEYPDIMVDWSYEKNPGIDPATVARGSDRAICWKCSKCGHEWISQVKNRTLQGQGCPECWNRRRGEHVLKHIRCIETGEVFIGIEDTAKKIGVSSPTLRQGLKRPNKPVGGYHWEYI